MRHSRHRRQTLQSWLEQNAELAELARRQVFFVGGAPRSGTTWLQTMLNTHPEISCRGEGHFLKLLAEPLGEVMLQRRAGLLQKNAQLFGPGGGYPLPEAEDYEFLVGCGILLALQRQCAGTAYRAVGEKTPDNVFHFPNLKRLFPAAKFIGIARDPRDSLTSAWHFFAHADPGDDEVTAKFHFLRSAIPPLARGVRTMLDFAERHPADTMIVTYETLLHDPGTVMAGLFRFLEVSDSAPLVADCLARTRFAVMSGGRERGEEQNGAFFRKGVSGDWVSTLTPEMSELVLEELGWMIAHFGWQA
jgi:hypothetical protein